MGLSYTPPGVQVSEVVTPSVNPLLAVPASVCIVGPSQGYVQRTAEPVELTNQDNKRIGNLPAGATLIEPLVEVRNINSVGAPYVENTDFVVNYNSAANEVQTLTIDATGGTFTLTFAGETTTAIAENATASTVETALEALGNLETVDVAVTGSAGGPYTITFAGQYANVNVPTLVADATALTGGSSTATVAVVTEGGVSGTIRRVSSGGIAQGETVLVTYRYIPANYYLPTRVDELSTVEELFGPAFSADGSVNSEVSLAASIAFENGARDLIVQALFRRASSGNPTSASLFPSDAQVGDSVTWEQTLYALRDIEDVNVLVPAVGQSYPGVSDSELFSIFTKFQDHVKFMAEQQQYVIAIFGEDSSASSSAAQMATIRNNVTALRSRHGGTVNEQIVYVNTSKFVRVNPATSQQFFVGGQYVAAAIGGMLASRAVSASLTREVLSGFLSVADSRNKADKNQDANLGLCVVETRGGNIWLRHAVTTDTSSTQRRELPVVRAKHRMIESVRNTLETQIIGKVIADGRAPQFVSAAIGSVLEQLKSVGDLVDYNNIQARTLTLDPTTVEVRFSYKPAVPLNYIRIAFSLDMTGDTGVSVIG